MSDRPLLIVNPQSGGGKTGATFVAMRDVIQRSLGEIDVAFTEAPRHAVELTREAVCSGTATIVAVGGDGSVSECVNGLMLARAQGHEARLGIIGQGTGGDFRRSLDIEHRLERYCTVIKAGKTRKVDVGKFSYADHDGRPAEAFFVNILSVGLSGLVDQLVAKTSKKLGGTAAYFVASTRGLLQSQIGRVACKFQRAGVTEEIELSTRTLAICNGRYFGAGMEVAPMADPSDGCFEVVDLGGAPKLAFALNSSRIYSGSHIGRGDGKHFRADRIELTLKNESIADRFLLDVDGEPLGRLPIVVELLPHAVEVLAP